MSNADDRCAFLLQSGAPCGVWRDTHPTIPFKPEFHHPFVEPAPQPAPSGDEAKVREIVEKWMDKLPGVSSFDIEAITKAGYAAGKATNPRCAGCGQIHEPCHLCPSGLCSAHQPVEGMVENITRELATAVVFIADNCTSDAAAALIEDMSGYQAVADAIARRGSEGK